MEFNRTDRHTRRDTAHGNPIRRPIHAPARTPSPRHPAVHPPTPSPRKIWPRSLFEKRSLIVLGAASIVILGCTAYLVSASYAHILSREAVDSKEASPYIENVEYQSILPKDKTINQLGGWTRISPPDKPPVHTFVDTIANVPVSVSQQPIPETFIGNVDKRVTELAKSYGATTELNTNETPIFIGTSAKGPQSVIFTKNNLLIMIKSESKIPNDAWVTYVNGLN